VLKLVPVIVSVEPNPPSTGAILLMVGGVKVGVVGVVEEPGEPGEAGEPVLLQELMARAVPKKSKKASVKHFIVVRLMLNYSYATD